MSSELREALDDLVSDVPRLVVAAGLASRTWRSGRRRRWRQRIGGAAVVLAATVLLGLVTVPPDSWLNPPWPATGEAGATSYPQRIGGQWWVRELPARPGPVAALVEVNSWGRYGQWLRTEQRGRQWHAVSPSGRQWRIPIEPHGIAPTLSPDGRYLGYLTDRAGPYVVQDLVNGERIEFPEIGSALMDPDLPQFGVYPQEPAYWSPRGDQVLVSGYDKIHDEPIWLQLGVAGGFQPVSLGWSPENWLGYPAGWVEDNTVLLFDAVGGQSDTPVTEVTVRAVSPDGQVQRELALRPRSPWHMDSSNQWTATASPDGSRILVLDELGSEHVVRVFSLTDGTESAAPIRLDRHRPECPAAWTGTGPAVLDSDQWGNYVTAVPSDKWDMPTMEPMVAVAPWLGSTCLIWATDALADAPREGPFGLLSDHAWTAWWRDLHQLPAAWWWREILLLTLVAGGLIALRLHRRRRLRPPRREQRGRDATSTA